MRLILVNDCNDCPFNLIRINVCDIQKHMKYCPLMEYPIKWKNGVDL